MPDGKENDDVVPFKYKYCRMCGWELRQGVLIFGEEGKRLQIPDKIRKTLAILVLEEDSLPKKICMDCCSSLEDYAVYKDTVLDAQEKLTSIANNLPSSSPNMFSPHCLQNGLHGSAGRGFDYSSSSFHQQSDRKLFADPAKTSSMQNESSPTCPSTSSDLTCKECGKKFRIRSEFERHKSIAGHHIQGSKQAAPLVILTSSAAPTLPSATITRSVNPPSSPTLSTSSGEPPDVEPEFVDLEDVQKETKIGIIPNAHMKNRGQGSQSTTFIEVSRTTDGTEKPPFQCKDCGKIVMTEGGLHAHVMAAHHGRRFQCKKCDKNYSQKVRLTNHILAEHTHPASRPPASRVEEVRFQCHLCPSYFTKKYALNVHKRSHTQSRPFECSICKKTFKTENCLGKHLKCHTAADTLACSMCDKRFWRKSKLEEHENTHGDRRPYGCNFCVKTFNSQPNYAKHVKRKHKEELRDGKIPPHVKIISGSPTLPNPKSSHPQISPQQEKSQVNLKASMVTPNDVGTPAPLPLTCSTSWLDFTRKHHQPQTSQQFHEHQSESQPQQPLAMNTTGNHTEHPMNLQQSHNGNGAGAQNQQMSHQHVIPQISHNSLSTHTQASPHQQSHSQGHSVNQNQSQPHSVSYNQHLQHRIQTHLASSHGQLNSQQQHFNPQHPVQSSHQQTHLHQSNLQQSHAHLVQYNSHQSQQHYGHHTQQQIQTLPLQLSSQNHYNNHSNSQSHALNAMELMDCAIQSFAADQSDTPQQNHPMELSYKLDSTFQDMPMELTKVFQTGPLELCVRNDFNQLVDLTAKEHTFNERMSGSSIMDFRQQPMDLISRNEVCGNSGLGHSDNNNLVDLSLRPSFQEQSESSFLRDLIDLSSRSDYQGELNLSSKGHLNHNSKAVNSLQNVYPDSMFNI